MRWTLSKKAFVFLKNGSQSIFVFKTMPDLQMEEREGMNDFEVIIKYHGDIEKVAQEIGAVVEILYRGYAIMTLDEEKLPQLYSYIEVEHIELPKLLSLELEQSLQAVCVSTLQREPLNGMNGDGVIVAVLDSGIEYTHLDFRNADGSSRILYIWDQSIEGTPPQGFFHGVEYTKEDIDKALQSEEPKAVVPHQDLRGHGTAVSGVAVGNGAESGGTYRGVAPKADILVVKLGTTGFASFSRTTEMMRAIKYAIEKARALQKPLVINMSYGTNDGSHTGDSLFESYITDVSNLWKTSIVVATGNEGTAGHHYSGRMASYEDMEIPFFTASGIRRFSISLFKNFVDACDFELIGPNRESFGIISMNEQAKSRQIGQTRVRMVYGQPTHYTVSQQVYFEVVANAEDVLAGLWKLRALAKEVVDGRIEAWLPTVEEVSKRTFFAEAEEDNTNTIPSTARKVVAVGGYDVRLGSMAGFSGRGTRRFDKPDLCAPATEVMTCRTGGGYDRVTGTSFAAPFVSGAAAIMMQWGIVQGNDPFLYGERVKAFLRLGAKRSEIRAYPNNAWGYGTLCVEETMKFMLKYAQGGGIWIGR